MSDLSDSDHDDRRKVLNENNFQKLFKHFSLNKSDNTLKAYNFYFNLYKLFVSSNGYKINSANTLKFLEHVKKKYAGKMSTQRQILKFVKAFHSFIHKKGYIKRDYTELIKAPQVESKKDLFMEFDDYTKMMTAAETPEQVGMLHILYYTGARAGELAGLRKKDLTFDSSKGIYKWLLTQQKNQGQSVLHFKKNPAVDSWFQKAGKDDYFIKRLSNRPKKGESIENMDLNAPPTGDMVLQRIKKIVRNAEKMNLKLSKDITTHMLRRLAGTQIYQSTGDLLQTKQFLRHSSSKTTEDHYVNVKNDYEKIQNILGKEGIIKNLNSMNIVKKCKKACSSSCEQIFEDDFEEKEKKKKKKLKKKK